MTDEVLYSGTLDKKARSTVFLGRRWVTRTMKLLRSKKIEYYDGDTRRGEPASRDGLMWWLRSDLSDAYAAAPASTAALSKPLAIAHE